MLHVLLPPSEGKAPGGGRPRWRPGSGRFGRRLGGHRRQVAEALAAVDGGDQRLLGVGGPTLDRARAANRALVDAPTLPAGERFTGVVWGHLDLATLSPPARARADDGVLVVSALLGVCALGDPVPDFRCKLSASLPRLGRLAPWWRPHLSAVLDDALAGSLVVDLLPQEHAAAWTPDPSRYDHRRVRLTDDRGRTVGHDAKAAKGRLARALLSAERPEQVLARGSFDGFALHVDAG